MTTIFDCTFTKTFDAICEAADTSNGLYIDQNDGSLLCMDWLSAAFTSNIAKADYSKTIATLDSAFTVAQHLLEVHSTQIHIPEIHGWVLAAMRAQQLFEAARERPTANAMINEIATHHIFHFRLPDAVKGCAVGLARAVNGPYSLGKTRQPNIVGEKYFYGEPCSWCAGFFQMAHMGLLTQLERLTSVVVKIVQSVTRLFGFPMAWLNQVHYFRNNETDSDIYDKNSLPMSLSAADATRFSSYWIGHATCLFSVPARETHGEIARINIITDPVEGDLNSLLYPRMTNPARRIEQCPPIHMCLLTHNHHDHLSAETMLKLLRFDPLVIVPKGDGERLRSMGFSRVIELGWLERIDVEIHDTDGKRYRVGVSGVPSNHGSGNFTQPCRTSLFNGYVIQSAALDGDVYFAGDTARLDVEHTATLRDTFAIRYNFQPGGPDEVRSLNVDAHQASCDGIVMHLHLMVRKMYQVLQASLERTPSFAELLEACSHLYTVYMHTKTYKLGNIHFDDTDASVKRLLDWLKAHERWDKLSDSDDLKQYEKDVLLEIAREEGTHLISAETGQPLTPRQIGTLLEQTIVVPKIGARFVGL